MTETCPPTWRLDNGEERLVEPPADATLPAAGPGRYSCDMEGQPDETGDAAARDGEPGDDSAGRAAARGSSPSPTCGRS